MHPPYDFLDVDICCFSNEILLYGGSDEQNFNRRLNIFVIICHNTEIMFCASIIHVLLDQTFTRELNKILYHILYVKNVI